MRYAVLGTGVVGRTVAARLASLGHEVVIGTRDPQSTLARAEYAEWQTAHPAIGLAGFAEAARDGEVLVNATGGRVSVDALGEADAADLDGKVLIDISNPLDFSKGFPPVLDPANDDSLGELIQRTFPRLRVVKTLNTMNCQIMVDPARVPGEHTVFLSGEDADAKKTVHGLLGSFGWPDRAILDLGGIETARGTEMLLPVWLRVMGALGHSEFNFHIQTADAPSA